MSDHLTIGKCKKCRNTHRLDIACKDTIPLRIALGEEKYREIFKKETGGWFIPDHSMTKLARETFSKMMDIISRGGQVDVVARCDGKNYRWECDGLKYAQRSEYPDV